MRGMRENREGITFSLSGIWDSADGSLAERMFWMIVDAAATPHTVPMLRNKYTVDVETACSAMRQLHSFLR